MPIFTISISPGHIRGLIIFSVPPNGPMYDEPFDQPPFFFFGGGRVGILVFWYFGILVVWHIFGSLVNTHPGRGSSSSLEQAKPRPEEQHQGRGPQADLEPAGFPGMSKGREKETAQGPFEGPDVLPLF